MYYSIHYLKYLIITVISNIQPTAALPQFTGLAEVIVDKGRKQPSIRLQSVAIVSSIVFWPLCCYKDSFQSAHNIIAIHPSLVLCNVSALSFEILFVIADMFS